MASFRGSLRAYLLTKTALTALVSTRIYSGTVPQGVDYPHIMITDISTFPRQGIASEDGQDEDRVQFDIYGAKYLECDNIQKELRTALNIKAQFKMGDYQIYSGNLENKSEFDEKDPDGTENTVKRLIVDYMFVRDITETP